MNQPLEKANKVELDPETWVDEHGDYLYNFALSRLRNPTNAENVVQEALLAALTAKDKFSGKSSERTWLIGILKHKIIDHFRKSYKEKPVTDVSQHEEAINDFFDHTAHLKKQPSDWIPEPNQLLENKEFWRVFNDCKNKLPAAAADAFTLREIENVDSKEICATLNISKSNFWVLLHRARIQLRECLEVNWFEKAES